MNQFRMLKPEDAAKRAKANVAAFKREQERKAAATTEHAEAVFGMLVPWNGTDQTPRPAGIF